MSNLVGDIGDNTPFWRSKYVYGEENNPVLMYNENFIPESGEIYFVDDFGDVYSIDIATQSQNWSSNTNEDTMVGVFVSNQSVFTTSSDANLFLWTANNGSQNWSSNFGSLDFSPPVFHNGEVFAADDSLHSYNSSDGSLNWSTNNGDSHIAVSSDDVFVGSQNETLYSFSRSDGSLNWTFSPNFDLQNGVDSPIYIDGTVYCGDQEGAIHSINASNGSRNWKIELGSDSETPFLSYENDTLFVSYPQNSLHSIDTTNQTENWFNSFSPGLQTFPGIDGDSVYVRSSSKIKSFDKSNGSENWSYSTSSNLISQLCITSEFVFCGNDGGELVAIDKETGNKSWEFFVSFSPRIESVDMEQTVWSYSNREGVTP